MLRRRPKAPPMHGNLLLCIAAFAATLDSALCFVPPLPGLQATPRPSLSLRLRRAEEASSPQIRTRLVVPPGSGPWDRSVQCGLRMSEAKSPSAYLELQERLFNKCGVLPAMAETPIMLALTQDTGRSDLGFVATADIARGDTLVSVPWVFAITADAAEKKNQLPSDMRLAITLLQVLGVVSGDSGGDERRAVWQSYAEEVLPKMEETSGANAGVLWSDDDVGELQFEAAVEDIKALKSHVDELVSRYAGEGGEASMDQIRWALGLVRGRSFLVDSTDGRRKYRALVPVADLFNHLPESPATWAAAAAEGDDFGENPWTMVEGDDGLLYFDIVTQRGWSEGDEVLLPYGLETSSELLASHGIILQHNEADFLPLYQDLVELVGEVSEIELGESTETARQKLELLQGLDAAEAPLSARPSATGTGVEASGHLVGCLQVAYAGLDELGMFEEEFDGKVGHYTVRPKEGPGGMAAARAEDLRVLALKKMERLCMEKLESVPTSLQQDEEALQSLSEDDDTPPPEGEGGGSRVAHKRLAIEYRMHAKELLLDFARRCAAEIAG